MNISKPLFSPEATQQRVVEVIKDVTGRKQMEEALQGSPVAVGNLSLAEMERRYIAQVLATESGHISNAAKVLRINRTTLYHQIKKYGLAP